jgi:nucleotide-binding universal stress UspA family protein
MNGKLVFGDDGSAAADVAWLWVNSHRWPGWQVDAITTTEPPLPLTPSEHREPVEWTPTWGREVFTEAKLESVKFLTAEGDPRVLLGDRTDADLIVVGSHDRSHLKALWVGSTTEWLLHHPPAPLAVVRSGGVVHHATVCTDGSSHSERALEAFVRLPWSTATQVTVACVEDGHVDTAAAIASASSVLDAASIPNTVEQLEGKPRKVIPDLLNETHPDLVVLGTRGLTGWKRMRFGSTAAAVVHTTHGSALFACADDADDAPEDTL